jgi:hypothetical protein
MIDSFSKGNDCRAIALGTVCGLRKRFISVSPYGAYSGVVGQSKDASVAN